MAAAPVLATLLVAQLAAAPPVVVHAVEADPLAPDKAAHFAVSYGVTLTGALVLEKLDVPRWQAVAIAGVATFLLGLAKETLVDDEVDGGDLLADGLGVAVAAGVVFAFSF